MSTPGPLEVEYHEGFRQRYSSLPRARQAACRRVIGSLIQRQSLPADRKIVPTPLSDRFLVVPSGVGAARNELNLLVNWTARLPPRRAS